MTSELQNALATLAQKLGASVEHIYPILVAQAKVTAGIQIIGWGVMTCLLLLLARTMFKISQKTDTIDPGVFYFLTAIGLLLAFAFGSCCACAVPDFLYPEAAVVKRLPHW